ncbi:MAG: hypothetical protein IJV17_05385 [Prevotella sp.]|nr:hypothetical protein [Prevotella sp.]
MKMFFYITIMAISILLTSCTNEKPWVEQVELKSYAQKLKVETLEDVLRKQTSSMRGGENEYIPEEFEEQINIVICSWDGWGRKKYNCQHGWGLCGFRWFPRQSTYLGDPIEVEIPSTDSYAGEIKENLLGNKYLEILLTETPDSNEVPPIYIDEDVLGDPLQKTFLDEENQPIEGLPTDLILKHGVYYYIPTIGQYGGYRITVE